MSLLSAWLYTMPVLNAQEETDEQVLVSINARTLHQIAAANSQCQ
jgi:hypothetical protein